MPIECAVSHSAATSSAVYSVPSSVLWVIETTPGWAWCWHADAGGRARSSCSGRSLPSARRERRAAWRRATRSGAPVSSTAMCAHSLHTTQSAGPHHASPAPSRSRRCRSRRGTSAPSDRTGRGSAPRPRRSTRRRRTRARGRCWPRTHRVEHQRVGAGGVVAGERAGRGGGHVGIGPHYGAASRDRWGRALSRRRMNVTVLGAGSWGTTVADDRQPAQPTTLLWARRETARRDQRAAHELARTCTGSSCRSPAGQLGPRARPSRVRRAGRRRAVAGLPGGARRRQRRTCARGSRSCR